MLKNLGMKNSDKSHDNYILLLLMLRAAWLTSLQFILNPNTCEVNILPCFWRTRSSNSACNVKHGN